MATQRWLIVFWNEILASTPQIRYVIFSSNIGVPNFTRKQNSKMLAYHGVIVLHAFTELISTLNDVMCNLSYTRKDDPSQKDRMVRP